MQPASNEKCPPEVTAHVQSVDLTDSENSMLSTWIATRGPLECQVESLVVIAGRLDSTSDPQVVGDFCGNAATLARFLSPNAKQAVRQAYLRFSYQESIAGYYFSGLRANQIDLRSHLKGRIVEDWSFEHPGLNDETWVYYLYVASLDQPGAYEALANKIAATQNGNDATNLLMSLAAIKTEGAKQILLRYASDRRRADGPNGPAATIAEMVAMALEMHF